jgi:hypothetical protein
MTDPRILDLLNDMLAAMEKSPHLRLPEAGVFLPADGPEELDAVQGVLEEDRRCAAALADLLLELGGSPVPGAPNVYAARLHYLDLPFMLRETLRCKKSLLAAGEAALGQLTGCPPAFQLVSKLAAAHRAHLALLQKLIVPTGSSAAARS